MLPTGGFALFTLVARYFEAEIEKKRGLSLHQEGGSIHDRHTEDDAEDRQPRGPRSSLLEVET